MKNETGRPPERPADSHITCAEDSRRIGEWPRCPDCGTRAATVELLERHYMRRCAGPIPPWRPWEAPRSSSTSTRQAA